MLRLRYETLLARELDSSLNQKMNAYFNLFREVFSYRVVSTFTPEFNHLLIECISLFMDEAPPAATLQKH